MDAQAQLLQPLIALVLWSFVMWAWMYATRIPAITKMKMKLDPNAPAGSQMAKLPPHVRWKADNYNHLMEQPTIFYAIVLALSAMGELGSAVVVASWAYVALRVAHSLVQALFNKIEVRFALFFLSNIPLAFLTFKAAATAF